MKRITLSLALCLAGLTMHGQRVADTSHFACAAEGQGVQVTPLHADSLCSSYLICITGSVPPHLHRRHTEHVTVLEGEALMLLGDSTFTVRAGQVIAIPAGTPHAATRVGDTPFKVVSVQAPFFDGTDRVPVEAPKR